MKKFLNNIKTKFFATETRKRSVENLKPSIDNMIIILYFVKNLNIAKFGNIIYGR